MKTFTVLATGIFIGSSIAATAPAKSAVDALTKIAPTSASCDGAKVPAQCATAQQAAGPIIDSFAEYGIVTPGEQAALLALMAFETVEFKFNTNQDGGNGQPRPGQGTRNMMMPDNVALYAQAKYPNAASISDVSQKLDKVIADGGEWASAAWYYTTKCDDTVKAGLKAGTQAGNAAYLTNCVMTTVTDDRTKYWTAAAQALGLSGQ